MQRWYIRQCESWQCTSAHGVAGSVTHFLLLPSHILDVASICVSDPRDPHPPQVPEPRIDLSVVYLLYNITKAAVLHGTKLQAADPAFTSRGITVVANCPGWCRVRLLTPAMLLSGVIPLLCPS